MYSAALKSTFSLPLCAPPCHPAEYGRFFLSWYSGLLIQHADRVLGAAKQVLSARCRPRAMREARELSDGGMLYVFEPAVQLSIKLAGVHWCVGGACAREGQRRHSWSLQSIL